MAEANATGGTKPGTSDEADDKQTTSESKDTTATEPTETAVDTGKVFTQADVDRIVTQRLKKAEAAWEKTKDLSEVEKLKAENEELKRSVAASNAFTEFEVAAAKQGVRNVRGLYKAISGDITLTTEGKIEDLPSLLKTAKSELPEFFGTAKLGDADGERGTEGKKKASDMNTLIRRGFGASG